MGPTPTLLCLGQALIKLTFLSDKSSISIDALIGSYILWQLNFN